MMNLPSLVQVAVDELGRKRIGDIQVETAYIWAARAVAAVRLNRLAEAHEYWHEAVEHAALAGDAVLTTLRRDASLLVPLNNLEIR